MLGLLFSVLDCFRSRFALQAEMLALRYQLVVLQRTTGGRKLGLRWADRSSGRGSRGSGVTGDLP